MAEKSNGEMYDEEELENIARFPQVGGLSKEIKGIYFSKIDSGTSMSPTIKAGDTIIWTKVENMTELKLSDIILFRYPIKADHIEYVAHRIIGIIESKKAKEKYFLFLTKGDNSSNKDRWAIPGETVLGIVIGVIYCGRKTPISKEFYHSIESAINLIEVNAPTAGRFVIESMPDGTFKCHSENLNQIALLGMLDCTVHKLREELRAGEFKK